MKEDSATRIRGDKHRHGPAPIEVDKQASDLTLNLVPQSAGGRHVSETISLDRVMRRAIEYGFVSEVELDSIRSNGSDNGQISWRQVSVAMPVISEALSRLAAEIYGFRKILVCEVGTLVYNNLLTRLISPLYWQRLFDEKVVPVLEYGRSPEEQDRLTLGVADPGSRAVRDLVHELPLTPIELVFVPSKMVSELQELLISNLNVIRMAVLSDSRNFVREFIDSDDALVPNEIIRRAA